MEPKVVSFAPNCLLASSRSCNPHHFAFFPRILILASCFTFGVLLQVLGCALYDNWWPMLSAFMYVIAPMPYCLFGLPREGGSGEYSLLGGSSAEHSGWTDVGKFLTGFGAIGSIGIPAILLHAAKIEVGAFIFNLCSVLVFILTAAAFEYFANDAGYY
ncbi:hypothetical protein CYMTET_25323 [Cymbomonas tetramitiformis]|uniref:Vacuolar protein sorting 55 n=1 Tax=Cymbomonas tetramitiformis TaxID=36881 RepID=A0AAE0KZC7_9CHLO|nr:hypothetical protein CYMTET_25323 [Cymbomonas tetramitiformis]